MTATARFLIAGAAIALMGAIAKQPAKPAAKPSAAKLAAKPKNAAKAVAAPQDQQAPPDQGSIAFADKAFPAASVDSKGDLTVTMFVTNTTQSDAKVRISFALRSARGAVVKQPVVSSWTTVGKGGTPTAITASAPLKDVGGDAFPLSGFVSLETATAENPAGKTIETLAVAAIERANDGAEWPLLYWAGLLSLVPIGLAVLALIATNAEALTVRIGSPKFSFTESWSSTITIAGTMLTGLITFTGFPNYAPAMNKTTYGIASLLCSTLILLAPGVFNLFRRTTDVKDGAGTVVQQTQRLVPFFLAAALLTTTGVVAQLSLLYALFGDLGATDIISMNTAEAFKYLCLALQGVLLIYAGVSTHLTVTEQAALQKSDDTAERRKVAAPPPQLPNWALL